MTKIKTRWEEKKKKKERKKKERKEKGRECQYSVSKTYTVTSVAPVNPFFTVWHIDYNPINKLTSHITSLPSDCHF